MTTGIIAASLNGVGTVGVAPEVTIMPIRVCDTSCPLSAIVEGMQYALDNGARIINFSLGSHTENPALEDAVATADALGAVLVAAAGNGGADNDTWPMYPASYPFDNVISVAATDRNDGLASGSGWASNFGDSSVDIGAPGKDVLTTQLGGDWTLGSGTSFAAPHVSGAVALVRTVRPLASPSEVSSFIFETADQVAALAGKTVTGGRLDAGAALWAASTPVAEASADPSSGAYPFTVRLRPEGQAALVLMVSARWRDGNRRIRRVGHLRAGDP
jgi:subtilisin family serine protease